MEQRKINEREDPRVLRTRHLLLQAFSDLYSEKGFHAMTVQDITDRARVNRGTFYSHFEDKPAILQEALFELLWQGFKSVAGSGLDQQIDLETVAMVTSWAIFGTGFQCFHQWDEQKVVSPPEELASQVTRVLMSGLAQALPAFPLK